MKEKNVFIVSYARTPIGSFRGQLSKLTATDLGSVAIKAAIERAGIKNDVVEEVFMGNVLQAGCGQAPSRQAALKAGLPHKVICTTINKVCASGLKSIVFGAQSIALGENDVVVAGGMESMSNTPFILPRGDIPYGGVKLTDSLINDGLTDSFNNLHMGNCAELIAQKYSLSREKQDEYAKLSYSRGLKAVQDGILAKEIIPTSVPGKRGSDPTIVQKDEELEKADFSKFSTLRPVFGETITAANASSLNDGAAAVVLMSEEAVAKHGCQPLAKIISYADAAIDPVDFGVAPSHAMPKALKRANITMDQIARLEINEAFSVVALANMKDLGVDDKRVNIHGGAVGLGHPLGMSGTRIVGTMALNMLSGEYGLAGVCNGGGGASAMLIQRI